MPLRQSLQFLKLSETDLRLLLDELDSTNPIDLTKAESIILPVIRENCTDTGISYLKHKLIQLKTCIDAWNNPETLRDAFIENRSKAAILIGEIMSQDPIE
jgi:hypothetical protein